MGPFCRFFRDIPSPLSGDFLPPGFLVWLPHSFLSQSLESPLVHLYSCLLDSIAVQEVAFTGQAQYGPTHVLVVWSMSGPLEVVTRPLLPQTWGVEAGPNAGLPTSLPLVLQISQAEVTMLRESQVPQLVLATPLTRLEEAGQVLPPLPLVLYAATQTAHYWFQTVPLSATNSLTYFYPHCA